MSPTNNNLTGDLLSCPGGLPVHCHFFGTRSTSGTCSRKFAAVDQVLSEGGACGAKHRRFMDGQELSSVVDASPSSRAKALSASRFQGRKPTSSFTTDFASETAGKD